MASTRLRKSPSGPTFDGNSAGDVVTWNGTEWVPLPVPAPPGGDELVKVSGADLTAQYLADKIVTLTPDNLVVGVLNPGGVEQFGIGVVGLPVITIIQMGYRSALAGAALGITAVFDAVPPQNAVGADTMVQLTLWNPNDILEGEFCAMVAAAVDSDISIRVEVSQDGGLSWGKIVEQSNNAVEEGTIFTTIPAGGVVPVSFLFAVQIGSVLSIRVRVRYTSAAGVSLHTTGSHLLRVRAMNVALVSPAAMPTTELIAI